VVSLLLVSSLLALPLLGLLVAPFGLIPVLRYQASERRAHLVWGGPALLLAALWAVGVTTVAPVLLALYLLLVAVPSLTVAWWQRAGFAEERWLALAAGAGVVLCLAGIALWAAPQPPVEATASWYRDATAGAAEMYSSLGLSRGEVNLALDTSARAVAWAAPVLPVIYLVVVLFWVRPRLALLGFRVTPRSFEAYRSEEWLPAAFAVTGLGTLLLGGSGRWVALNLLVTVLILYFVHGLAIIRAHLVRWVGRGWLVRWGVALVCIQGPLPLLVAALGVTDSFFQLRPAASDDGGTT
jgi:hypothetical protein